MAHQLFQLPRPTAISSNLTLISGAKVSFFLTGTSTPTNTYQDSDLTTPHTNPVEADSAGRLPVIYLDPSVQYRVTFTDGDDVEIYPAIDPVNDLILSQAVIGGYLNPRTAAEIAAGVTPTNYACPPGNVLRYGTNADPGVTDMTAAFTAARAVTSGRYHIPQGTYLVDASPDVWADAFTADGDTTLVIDGDSYDISNAFAGRLRYRAASSTKADIVDAPTGNVVMYLQNSEPGTATGFTRGLAFTTDSHWCQVQPATDGGSVDLLWQRSTLNDDPAGNRFSETFDEANDRFLVSYATTLSGSPSFDSAIIIGAGPSGYMHFPALQPQFNQGWSVKQRASGGFELELVPGATFSTLRNKGTPTNINMTFGDGTLGFYGASPGSKPTISGSRGGNAALQSLLTALANMGLITDSTT